MERGREDGDCDRGEHRGKNMGRENEQDEENNGMRERLK